MNPNHTHKTILIAVLNWGLGHATRCIPLIKALQEHQFIPIIASDGAALALLKKEFPTITTLKLPSYHITYPKKGKYFKWHFIKKLPKIISAIRKEQATVQHWIKEHHIEGILSDNRLGVYSSQIPSVYITHQLQVLSGNTSWISSAIHHHFIKKHKQCWIPDFETKPNLSFAMGHSKTLNTRLRYIGPLSRFQKKTATITHDLMIILSGPEPQRSILENQLIAKIDKYTGSVLFIKGIIEKEQKKETKGMVTYYNFMNSTELETAINGSQLILCRSGYTSIMDLAHLEKKAFLIPTPGQYEQEYLAKKLQQAGIAPFSTQETFGIEKLQETNRYSGFPKLKNTTQWENLFKIFTT